MFGFKEEKRRTKLDEIIELKRREKLDIGFNYDDDGEDDEKGGSHGNTRLPYGLCQSEGIDTTGMSPKDAWAALEGKGYSPEAEYKKLKERNSSPKNGKKKLPAVPMSDREMQYERDRIVHDSYSRIWEETNSMTDSIAYLKRRKEGIEKRIKECKDEISKSAYSEMSKDELNDKFKELREETSKKYDEYVRAKEEREGFPLGPDITEKEKNEFIKIQKKQLDSYNAYIGARDKQEDAQYILSVMSSLESNEKILNNNAFSPEGYEKRRNELFDEYDKYREKYDSAVRAKFPTVDKCKTIEDISDYLNAQDYSKNRDLPSDWLGGYTKRSNDDAIDGLDVEKLKYQISSMESTFEKAPILKKVYNGFKFDSDGSEIGTSSWAATDAVDGIITFGKALGRMEGTNIEEEYKKTTVPMFGESGERVGTEKGKYPFHPAGCTAKQIIVHELCHNLDLYTLWKGNPEATARENFEGHNRCFSNSAALHVSQKMGINFNDIWKGVSRYAGVDLMEWYAEAVSSYLLGNDCEQGRLAYEFTLDRLKSLGVNTDSRDDADEEWITINGTHVMVDPEGNVTGGGKLNGTKLKREGISKSSSCNITEKQRKALSSICKKTAGLKKEQYRIIDGDGNVVVENRGGKDSVAVTVGEKREHLEGNISVHNHPAGGTFSLPDLRDFGYGAKSITVSSPEGTYTLINEKYDTPERYKGWNAMKEAMESSGVNRELSFTELQRAAEEAVKKSETYKKYEELSKEAQEILNRKPESSDYEAMDKFRNELNEWCESSGYNRTAEELKALREKERRVAETKPYDDFYREHASEYGFKYEFEPTRKDSSEESFDVNIRNALTLQKLWHVDKILEIIEDRCFGGEITDWGKAFYLCEIVGAEIPTQEEIQALNESGFRMDDEGEEEGGSGKKVGHGNTRLPYGLCNKEGINTKGMTPKDAWEALKGKGYSPSEEYKKLKERNDPKSVKAPEAPKAKTYTAEDLDRFRKERKEKKYDRANEIIKAGAVREVEGARSYGTPDGDDYLKSKKSLEDLKKKYGVSSAKEYNEKFEQAKRDFFDSRHKSDKLSSDLRQYRHELLMKYTGLPKDFYYVSEQENQKMLNSATPEEIEKLDKMIADEDEASRDYLDKQTKYYVMQATEREFSWHEGRIKGYEALRTMQEQRIENYRALKEKYEKEDAEYYEAIRSKLPDVDSCKSLDDLAEYCEANGFFSGVDKPRDCYLTSFSEMASQIKFDSLETGKRVVRSISEMCAVQPVFKECLNEIYEEELGSNTFADANTETYRIRVNRKWYDGGGKDGKTLDESYNECLRPKYTDDGKYADDIFKDGKYSFHVQGTTADSIIKHESSHVLDYWLTYKLFGLSGVSKDANRFSAQCKKDVCKKLKITQRDAWKQVSAYGNKNTAEFFAEAYGAYLCGVHNPVIDAVGEYTDEAIKSLGISKTDSADENETIDKLFGNEYNNNRVDSSSDIYFGIAIGLGWDPPPERTVAQAIEYIKEKTGVTHTEMRKALSKGGAAEEIKSLIEKKKSEAEKASAPKPKGKNKPPTGFASEKLESRHYKDHVVSGEFKSAIGKELTKKEYVERGKELLSQPADGKKILGYLDHLGRVVRFNTETFEYATGVPGGIMSTYFIAKYNHDNHKMPTKELAMNYYEDNKERSLAQGGKG